MTTRPYPYQREGALQIERFGGVALLADEMGLGKSYQALLYAHRNPDMRPIVVVCPAVIKYVWEREASVHFGMRATVLEGRRPYEFDLMKPQLIVLNYDILEGWLPTLLSLKPQLLIADECHLTVNHRAKRTKATRKLAKRVPHRIFISGTPLMNRPAELWTILNMLRPDIWSTFYTFAESHCAPKLTRWGFDYSGAANLPVLNRKMKRICLIRRLKKDVMKDLPPKTRVVVPVEIENRKEYERAYHHFIQWLAKQNYAKMSKAVQAEWLSRMSYLHALIGRLKLKACLDWTKNFMHEDGGKLIAFGWHRDVLRPLHNEFPHSVLVDGSITGRDRQARIDRFNQDPKCRNFFGNIKAAGVGWSCKSTSNGAFYELAWAPAYHTQAEDRNRGLMRGIEGMPTTWYYLIARDTIEEKHCERLQKKQAILDGTLDGGANIGGLELYDDLNAELLKEAKERGYR